MLSHKEEKERQFIEAAAEGNLKIVKNLFENESINIDCAMEVPPKKKKKKKKKDATFKAST